MEILIDEGSPLIFFKFSREVFNETERFLQEGNTNRYRK